MAYERLTKGELPVLAVCYDFDKTLSPDNMQAQGYIQSVDCDVDEFWRESNRLAEENGMDMNLAYMYTMCKKAKGKFYPTLEKLLEYGSRIRLYEGVEEWFPRVNAYGRAHGVQVEHYILSSGLREMIEGTSVAGEFKRYTPPPSCSTTTAYPYGPLRRSTTPTRRSSFSAYRRAVWTSTTTRA